MWHYISPLLIDKDKAEVNFGDCAIYIKEIVISD